MNDEFDNANIDSYDSLDSASDVVVDETVNEEPAYREEVEVQEPNVKIEEPVQEDDKTIVEGQITDVTLLDKLSEDGTFYSSSGGETQTQAVEDYTNVLNDIGQLVTYSNCLLLVILVFIVLFMGIFSGHVLTTWFRNRQ